MATTAEGFVATGAELRKGSAPFGAADVREGRAAEPRDDRPQRCEGLELLGAFDRSGHRQAPSLIRRADGQVVQLTPLLYAVVEEIDDRRTYDEVAAAVGERIGRSLAPEDVRTLVVEKLRPLGLLKEQNGSQPAARKANPLLALRFRVVITNPRVTGAISAVFSKLFWPPLVVAFSLAFLTTMGWLLFDRGLAGAARHALYEPGLLLVVIALMGLSAGFHELGHAAACRYSGARPGVMGAGLYLVWPAFYTDVSDSYRLERGGRLRVDLGGIYFNAIFAVAAYGLWALTGWEALLIVIPFQAISMLRQLIPLIRLDGYHILADLTGVPDLFAHIKPILKSLAPWRWGRGDAKHLKPWVRGVVTLWVLLVVPILALIFGVMVFTLPRVVATAWDSMQLQWDELGRHVGSGDIAAASVAALSIVALAIPILSVGYLLVRVVRRNWTRVWRATEGHPVRRGIAIVVAAAMVAGLLGAWWPGERYRPIQPSEQGALLSLRGAAWPVGEVFDLVGAPQDGVLAGYAAPEYGTEGAVDPAEVGTSVLGAETASNAAGEQALPSGGFPFPIPEAPGEGDNQALAINTTDGASLVDIALSLVFMDGETVDNTNEAYALASCLECLTVAIAFQVVVILDAEHDIIPENVAAAINVACVTCVTQAIAIQLVVTLTEPLTEAEMAELEALWAELERLEDKVGKLPLDEIYAQLGVLQAEIDALLDEAAADDEGALASGATSDQDTAQQGTVASNGTEAEDEAIASPTPTPTASPSPSPTGSPSPTSSPSPSSSPTSSPSDEPTPEP